MQTARLPEPFAGGFSAPDMGPFQSLRRAPFPRTGGGGPRFGPRIELELDPGPSAAAEARAAIIVLDGRADPDLLDDVRLLLSEVVTNAVRHAGLPTGSKIMLAVSIGGGAIRAEVTDAGRGFEPSPRSTPRTEAGGWGLHLVDRIASRWGVDRTPVRVWFEIDAAA
jgi:anti-sigma regulatory factor (Ser/Thr protein kinase)